MINRPLMQCAFSCPARYDLFTYCTMYAIQAVVGIVLGLLGLLTFAPYYLAQG